MSTPCPHGGDTNPTSKAEADTEQGDSSELQGSSEQPAEPERVPVVTIPLVSKKEYPVFQEKNDEWADTYPAVDALKNSKTFVSRKACGT